MLAGLAGWALSAGIYSLMAVLRRDLGHRVSPRPIRCSRCRLVGAAPALASASVSLNTSALYIGQAIGSAIGGFLYARELFYASGYVATAFVALAVIAVILTKPRKGRGA